MGPHGKKKIQTTSVPEVHNIIIHCPISYILVVRVSTNENCSFHNVHILEFCLLSLTWGRMGVKVSNDIFSESTECVST